jgi:SPX domain protein involved in polyphosphate accumulation
MLKMAIEVFNRYENKYMVDEKTYARLQTRLSDYMKLDSYNKRFETYPICNIYYDTPDSHLIRTSLMKPSYKEKIRLRSYGTPSKNSKVYVEIKKKFRGLGNKRRSALPLDEAYAFLASGKIPDIDCGMNIQVLSEIAYMLEQHRLVPKVYLSCERRAYFGTGRHDLRISFDTDIVARREDLFLESGIYGKSLLPEGKWLMEIKTSESIPIWLCRTLSELHIYPVSFSKYGTEYKLSLASPSPHPPVS